MILVESSLTYFPDHGSFANQIKNSMRDIGREEKWSEEKIKQEQEYCFSKMLEYIKKQAEQ